MRIRLAKGGFAMAVVKEFDIGNTHIRICDDSCVKTKEEIEEILRRCSEIWHRAEVASLK